MSHIICQLDSSEMDRFFSIGSAIGSYIIFPAHRVNGKMTINAARGFHQKLNDRFDLALECIRLFYSGEDSPLSDVFRRYTSFFSLFKNFREYVDFFLLQDLVEENYRQINFWHPFESFKLSPLPKTLEEYIAYREKTIGFINARNQRIADFANY